jgi:hypothetical protein
VNIINTKEMDNFSHKLIQEVFDSINKDFYSLEPMLVPMCPSTPAKIVDLDI